MEAGRAGAQVDLGAGGVGGAGVAWQAGALGGALGVQDTLAEGRAGQGVTGARQVLAAGCRAGLGGGRAYLAGGATVAVEAVTGDPRLCEDTGATGQAGVRGRAEGGN